MKSILCVSCAAAPVEGYSMMLRALGYTVDTGSLDEILPALHSGRRSLDLVIAECEAAVVGTDDVLWQIRRALPKTPVLLISSCTTVEFYLRAQALGVHEYLCRPLQDEEVVRAAKILLANETDQGRDIS